MFKENVSKTIKFWSMIGIIIIAIIVAGSFMFKYSVEGEKKLPYKLSKITIISTAEGIEDTDNKTAETPWNLKILQINDIYISIDKTQYAKEKQELRSVRIENIKITKSPKRGGIKIYMPNSSDGRLFSYNNESLVQNTLQYNGASKSNPKTLEIGKQGGSILISFANTELGKFISSEKDVEIKHDGTIISKINESTRTEAIITEDIQFSVSFDLVLKIDDNEYKGTVNVDMPSGDIISNGIETQEITDFKDVVFKKI